MGSLFYRGCPIDQIENMPFHKMKYWGGWCDVMAKAEKDAVDKK